MSNSEPMSDGKFFGYALSLMLAIGIDVWPVMNFGWLPLIVLLCASLLQAVIKRVSGI